MDFKEFSNKILDLIETIRHNGAEPPNVIQIVDSDGHQHAFDVEYEGGVVKLIVN